MLRKFLTSAVIASILILLATLTTEVKAASVTTLTSRTALPTIPTTKSPTAANTAANISSTASQLAKKSIVNKFLSNAGKETTTSLLPLQPPLNVTSTTLASLILNQKHQQQQRQRKQQQALYLQRQRQQRQLQEVEEIQKLQQSQIHEQLLSDNVEDNKETKKKNLDSSIVAVKSSVDVITPEPSSTHAYIPFDLDYNDPTEEKAAEQSSARQSTINEVINNLFPKGFSDIFRFSYAGEPEPTATTTTPMIIIRSSPAPFKPMPTAKSSNTENATLITVSATVTREIRREIRPGHTEIIVEKVITDHSATKSSEDFKDGSNSISKDELLRINRAAKEASVLPSLLLNPQSNSSGAFNSTKAHIPIVILNENSGNDDFVEAPEDDNQIAETQDVFHQVVQPPPAESINFHVTPNHQYNVRIIHDNSVKTNQNSDLTKLESAGGPSKYNVRLIQDNSLKSAQFNEPVKQDFQSGRSSPSYQTFVEQSKYLQNSLQEAPSRKFLKNFQNPILSGQSNPMPVPKGNFHYEQGNQQNYIQTVGPIAQMQYMQYHEGEPRADTPNKEPPQTQNYQQGHAKVADSPHVSDNDIYQIGSGEKQPEHTTPTTLVFVTINTPTAPEPQQLSNLDQTYDQEPHIIPAHPIKSPHDFVSNAMAYSPHMQRLMDHQAEQTENSPKPSNGGYTFVEVQKSINIHNKLITEKDGRLIEQHETIYPEQKYTVAEGELREQEQLQPSPDYVSLSQNPIHVEHIEEQHESAASVRDEQHAPSSAQHLEDFGPIQQSNLIQESHVIESVQQHEGEHEQHDESSDIQQTVYAALQEEHQSGPEHQVVKEDHLTGEILPQPANIPQALNVEVPYAVPTQEAYHSPSPSHVVVQEIVERHIPVPYGVPEPVGIPVHIQHFIDRPIPVETIVEKPVPYPVEKVVEKVVEKHVPVEVEKIVEKPVEVVVKKFIDRPVAIPIKIPVALHLPAPQYGPPPYGPSGLHYAPTFSSGHDHASTWPQSVNGGTFARVPSNILKAYYAKMLKKLVPQMQQAYKNAHAIKGIPKITQKPYLKPKYKISDMFFDLKPPPPRPKVSSSWDVGARYQFDYNTLPIDLSASSSISTGVNLARPGQGYKTNYDEFQRWRNGHSLKRSPDFGRNLHMEYGFKPPLIPSVEIDDKGVPLKTAADLTKGN